MSQESAFRFDQRKTFYENYNALRVWLYGYFTKLTEKDHLIKTEQ